MDLEFQIIAGLFGFSFGVPLFILCCLNPGREFFRIRKSVKRDVQGLIDTQKEAEAKRKAKRAAHKEATKLARAKRGHGHIHEERDHDTMHRIKDMDSQWVKKKKVKRVDEKNSTLKEEKADRKYLSRFHNTKGKKHDAFSTKKDRAGGDQSTALVELPHHGEHKHGSEGKEKKTAPPKKKGKKAAKVHADPKARHLSKHQKLAKAKGKKMAVM
jgi:hypothetical protein